MHKVSAYVPCYNGKAHVAKCLDSILKQTHPVDEILVIDDGSGDGSASIVSEFPVRVIRNGRNLGLAATRNVAMREARNELVASVDADCAIGPEWLEKCVRCFDDHTVAAVGGCLTEAWNENIVDRWRRTHLKHRWGDKRLYNPVFLSGSNLVVKKGAVEAVGHYDETRYRNNYEDVDLSLRLKVKGFNLVYEPAAKAWHMRRDTLVSLFETFWRWKFHDYKAKYLLRPVFNLVNSGRLILEDAANKNPELIPVDMLAFIFSSYFDSREFLKRKR